MNKTHLGDTSLGHFLGIAALSLAVLLGFAAIIWAGKDAPKLEPNAAKQSTKEPTP